MTIKHITAALLLCIAVAAQAESPSPVRLKADVEKLVSFGTRHTLSSATDPKRGIGAARAWARAEFERISKACKTCLKVETLERQMSGPRVPNGVNIVDVLAVKPGKMGWSHVILITGHIDSRASDVMDFKSDAPGANDDGSGSALVIEAARIMSQMPQTQATIVFALLSGEEQGLMGGRLLTETAKERGWKVSAWLNNDIVGNTIGTDGRKVEAVVRVFSEGIRASEDQAAQLARRNSGGENDGASRALMRFTDKIAEGEIGSIGIDVVGIRRPDRFGRGGDHLPALDLGFPAIRFSVGVENYRHQHQNVRREGAVDFGDTVDKMDFDYLAKVTALNVATANFLSMAPPAPETAVLAGSVSSDTLVKWTPVTGAAGYRIYWRRADRDRWEEYRDIDDPTASQSNFEGVIVDDHFFGVAALDAQGHESLITFASLPPRN